MSRILKADEVIDRDAPVLKKDAFLASFHQGCCPGRSVKGWKGLKTQHPYMSDVHISKTCNGGFWQIYYSTPKWTPYDWEDTQYALLKGSHTFRLRFTPVRYKTPKFPRGGDVPAYKEKFWVDLPLTLMTFADAAEAVRKRFWSY